MVCPSHHHFVPLVLQLILPSPEKFAKLLLHIVRITLVLCVLNKSFMQIVSHVGHWFRLRCLPNLPNKLITELVLATWLHQEWTTWLQVKHSIVFFGYKIKNDRLIRNLKLLR